MLGIDREAVLKCFTKGEFAEVERICLPLLARPSDRAFTQFVLGLIKADAGSNAAAEPLLHEAVAASAETDAAIAAYCELALRRQRASAGIGLLDVVLRYKPADPTALWCRGRLLQSQGMHADAIRHFDEVLRTLPSHSKVLASRGASFHALGNHAAALAEYDRAVAHDNSNSGAWYNRGILLVGLRRLAEAAESFRNSLETGACNAEAQCAQGQCLLALDRADEALACFDAAIHCDASSLQAHIGRARANMQLGRKDEAFASFDTVLAIMPDHPDALYGRSRLLQESDCIAEALADLREAIRAGSHVQALYDIENPDQGLAKAYACHQQSALADAIVLYEQVLARAPGHADAAHLLGQIYGRMNEYEKAEALLEQALAGSPGFAVAWGNYGNILATQNKAVAAMAAYDRAISLDANQSIAHYNRAELLLLLERYDEAIAAYDRALALAPGDVGALIGRGGALIGTGRPDLAGIDYTRAFERAPEAKNALAGAVQSAMYACDWNRLASLEDVLEQHIRENKSQISPFIYLGIVGSPERQLLCARNYVARRFPQPVEVPSQSIAPRDGRIRLAYVSADFRQHPMMSCISELLEIHDRTRFEVVAVALCPDDGNAYRKRITQAVDKVMDFSAKSDAAASADMRAAGIDIAIDLSGHTNGGRPGIFLRRPAPVQISYIGFPGTLALPCIDYIVGDRRVIPQESRKWFAEKVIELPDSYWVNDAKRHHPSATLSRSEAGLPRTGFVYCCFNTSWKITRAIFQVWMHVLKAVDGSVLWLLQSNDAADGNLKQEAARLGIDPARIVFAPRLPPNAHLARLRLADLSLDTLPYNAHTTAVDSIWVGVPVITCRGDAFAGRVGASLLHAIGKPEFVTGDLGAYGDLAIALGLDDARIQSLKRELASRRGDFALFDTRTYCRHLETGFAAAVERARQGLPPDHIVVPR